MVAGIALFGVVDGSLWKALLSPTLAYRPAILFGLTLLFGWRGLVWNLALFLAAFSVFLGWRGAAFMAPVFVLSQLFALMAARKLAGGEPWLSREKSTWAFLAGAALAPLLPALVGGMRPAAAAFFGWPTAVNGWLRGTAPILAIVPAVLVYGSGRFKQWAGFPAEQDCGLTLKSREVLELSAEVIVWSLTLWITVVFKARYGLNVTYLTFIPLMVLTLMRGMRLATLALAANAIVASTLWLLLHWASVLSDGDLRLLLSIYSLTILVLAAVVDERKRNAEQVQQLLVQQSVLGEREKHFRTLANSAPVMIWMSGPDKLCTFVNKRWLDFTGFTLDQQLGYGWADALHPDDRDSCLSAFGSASDARTSHWMECRARRADGEYRWIITTGEPLYQDGQFAGLIGTCLDITERKFTLERLRESQVQLAYAQRLAKVGSFELDVKAGTIQFSEKTLQLFGLSGTPDTVSAGLELVHPNDRMKVLERGKTVLTSAAPVEVEYRIVVPNGESRVVRSILECDRNQQGEVVKVLGACQDVTDQVEARNRLEQSEQRLKSAQNLAQVGSWYWDLEANLVICSDECKRIFGHPEDYQASLEGLLERVVLRDRERVGAEIRASLQSGSGCSTEFQIFRTDGALRYVTFASRILMNAEGSPGHVFGACQDVTDIRRAQEEVFAKQKLETLGGLANGIAHDVNNLLGGVVAQAELALSELECGASPIDEVTSIREVAMRGSEIVRELMIYGGTDTQELAPLDLSKSVDEMLAFLKTSVSKRTVIETQLARDLPQVSANSSRISRLLVNLVANASEAIGDGEGFIRVTTQRIAAAGATLMKGDSVRLEICDTGPGMSSEIQARAFEPFFSTKPRGRGLGLAVVDGIVRSLGGVVQLESVPQKGTSVRITLPGVVADSRLGGANTSASGGSKHIAPRVLIVEDENPLRAAVSKMLAKAGFPVIEAADGTQALNLIRDQHRGIDLLILDISIPGAPSSEIFWEASRSKPGLPIIVTSAYAQDVAAASLQAEVARFLRKPYRLEDLLNLISQARA
jgi:PAS domain S-box-containing protein